MNAGISSFFASDSVRITIDNPSHFNERRKTVIVFFALPNGNSTEQTMGKKMKEGDDWHFDIQHIKAQTSFIRKEWKRVNFIVVYLENNNKSWPLWKQRHPAFRNIIPALIDSLTALVPGHKKEIYLNGHSGGGSFVFGYLAGVDQVPLQVKRISFLDSDYAYDTTYYAKLRQWLSRTKGAALNVFAYNDSVALLNGKSFVSATGGTWYRSWQMLHDLERDFSFRKVREDSLIVFKSTNHNIQFFFKTNPERKIFHTQQVELNGFIHSVFSGTEFDSRKYNYYSGRAYSDLIE
jgi:pimeloyl-ACP methyl ester carboxylesterase